MKKIKIKYFTDIEKINRISIGDWTDLRSAEDIELKAGEHTLIHLGVGMKLPKGYEAIIAPRSSTYKNFHIIQTNHIGIVDNSYSGNTDEWMMSVYALEDTKISKNDRVCQFRIQKSQPMIKFVEVDELDKNSRGGFGSTGTN